MKTYYPVKPAYDKLWVGILLGLCIPFTLYGILLMVYEQFDAARIFGNPDLSGSYRQRTIAIIALLGNAVAMQWLNKKNATEAMRGIIFPSIVYIAIWLWMFGKEIMG
jgi:amino acid permease